MDQGAGPGARDDPDLLDGLGAGEGPVTASRTALVPVDVAGAPAAGILDAGGVLEDADPERFSRVACRTAAYIDDVVEEVERRTPAKWAVL